MSQTGCRLSSDRRNGFSLIELVVVVFILALLSAIVMMSVGGHVRRARLTQTLDRIETLDRLARDQARASQSLVRLDFTSDEIKLVGPQPRTVALGTLELIDGPRQIVVLPSGQSATYGVSVQSSGPEAMSLVVLGRSGQARRMNRLLDDEDREPRSRLR